MHRLLIYSWSASSLLLAFAAPSDGGDPGHVELKLRPEVRVTQEVVQVGDVVEFQGGDQQLFQHMAAQDIAHVDIHAASTISRKQLEIRLRLAGFTRQEYRLTGAAASHVVHAPARVTNEELVQAVTEALIEHWDAPAEDVEVVLASPMESPWELSEISDPWQLVVDLPATVHPGRLRLPVRIASDDGSLPPRHFTFEAAIWREVARTAQLVPRGEQFTETNVQAERMKQTGPQRYLPLQDVLNQSATRTLASGQWLELTDVTTPTRRNNAPLIRVRDPVRVVARKSGLTVVLSSAEALQSGNQGESIRVRNRQSGRTFTGRIVGPAELEIRF